MSTFTTSGEGQAELFDCFWELTPHLGLKPDSPKVWPVWVAEGGSVQPTSQQVPVVQLLLLPLWLSDL